MGSAVYKIVSLILIAAGVFLAVATLGSSEPQDSPRYGQRGLKRQEAIDGGGLFATTEPLMRLVASWFGYLPIADQRRDIDQLLRFAGDWLGITANEFFGLSFLGFFAGIGIGLVAASMGGYPPVVALVPAAMGAALPYFEATGERVVVGRHLGKARNQMATVGETSHEHVWRRRRDRRDDAHILCTQVTTNQSDQAVERGIHWRPIAITEGALPGVPHAV